VYAKITREDRPRILARYTLAPRPIQRDDAASTNWGFYVDQDYSSHPGGRIRRQLPGRPDLSDDLWHPGYRATHCIK
jgi:hypothetical protein